MTTKALFMTAMGGPKVPMGPSKEFVRTSGDILTSTAHGLATGAGPYKVKTTNADAPSGLVAAVHSSLVYSPSTDVQDETVTIDGKVYLWRDVPAADGEVDVNASDVIAADNLAAAINLGLGAGTAYDVDMVGNPNVKASSANGTVLVEAVTLDATLGDAIAVAEAAAGAWAGAAVFLENGADGTDYFIIRLTDNTFSLATSRALAEAGTAQALADAGTGVHQLVCVVETLADAMEDVVENYLTATGTRVNTAVHNIARFWQSVIDGTANGDVS